MKSGYDQFFKNARVAQIKQGMPAPKMSQKKSVGINRSSKEVASELRGKLAVKKKRNVRPFPWKLAGMSFLGLALAAFGFLNLDEIEKSVHKIEISLLGQAIAAETTPPKGEKKSEAKKENEENTKAENTKSVEKKDFSADEINHLSKLNERKKELDLREEELSKLETELQTQKTELEAKLKELEKTRNSISQILDERVQADDKKVDTLVQFYSSMKPQQAAKIFETLDEDLAVEIIGRMKKKNAAEILNLLKPEKAQVFSERYAGYKKK